MIVDQQRPAPSGEFVAFVFTPRPLANEPLPAGGNNPQVLETKVLSASTDAGLVLQGNVDNLSQ